MRVLSAISLCGLSPDARPSLEDPNFPISMLMQGNTQLPNSNPQLPSQNRSFKDLPRIADDVHAAPYHWIIRLSIVPERLRAGYSIAVRG